MPQKRMGSRPLTFRLLAADDFTGGTLQSTGDAPATKAVRGRASRRLDAAGWIASNVTAWLKQHRDAIVDAIGSQCLNRP